jgi:acyl-CoA thioester hydrolase
MEKELFITHRGVVYPDECDHMGHLNVSHYVSKFDQATWQMFAALGITPGYMRDNHCGVAAVRQEITYRRELLPGDVITICTGVLEMRERVIRFYHEMTNDETGEIAATTIITGVHMDTQARKACPFPDDILERGRGMQTDYQPVM